MIEELDHDMIQTNKIMKYGSLASLVCYILSMICFACSLLNQWLVDTDFLSVEHSNFILHLSVFFALSSVSFEKVLSWLTWKD